MIKTFFEFGDKFAGLRNLSGMFHLSVGRFRCAITNVTGDSAGEENRFLRHVADFVAKHFKRKFTDINTIDQNSAGSHIIKTGNQADKRRLTTAGTADKSRRLARFSDSGILASMKTAHTDTTTASNLPEKLRSHPLFLMLAVLKRARQQGLTYQMQQNQPDVHLAHIAILSCLEKAGPLSQRSLSELLNIDQSDLVGILDKLETIGYAQRSTDQHDRRRHVVAVTPMGKKILPQAYEQSARFSKNFLSPLSSEEQQQLRDLLIKIVDAYR